MKNNFYIDFILIAVFILFGVYRHFCNVETLVLKVFSPTVVAVDFNGNRQLESGEVVCISGIKTFSDKLVEDNDELAGKLGLSAKEALLLAYFSKDFSTELLMNRNVSFKPDNKQKKEDCLSGDILIDGMSYRDRLISEGFAYSDEPEFDTAKIYAKVNVVKNFHPVILNRKSKKYHEIACKYGKASEDYALLLKNDLPTEAIPCKWCHNTVPNAALSYPDRIKDGAVKMFLTDMTSHFSVKNECSSSICQAFLQEINNAKSSIDIAAYGWVSIPELDRALKAAVERGVRLRIVYDYSGKTSYYPDTAKIAEFAQVAENDFKPENKRTSEYLMHNKFMIFDGKKVATGSLNYSKTDFSEFNSNFIIFIDFPEVAQEYLAEFEQMLGGKFHTDKERRIKYRSYKVGSTDLEVYFSPQDKIITERVISYLDNAQKYIYLPVFVITHKSVENALVRARLRGVDVKVIVDATNVSASKSSVKSLRMRGIPVKIENYAGKLHSKSIIIDDKYVLAGSMNFSFSGESRNDENMLIIKNPRLAVFYKDFFIYLWSKIPDKYLMSSPRAESSESIGSCFDGIDNDFDGRIDNLDEGCFAR